MNEEHVDVLIVGAGISGIGAGYHLQKHCPDKSYVILERRENLGGTWDLFRYPGIRSDSDMYTLGYSFRPWTDPKAIADGPSILRYLNETADEYGIRDKIRHGIHVKRVSWSTAEAKWTVETLLVESGETKRFTCSFLFMCAGYYDYDEGYTPDFPGLDCFQGKIAHPQKWTEDIEYAGERVVVIGSGATAMTLVPEMAKTAASMTMLQRSPTYVVAAPSEDRMANALREHLPDKLVYSIVRARNVLMGAFFFWFCRRYPERAKRMLLGQVRQHLGPDYDVRKHFTPRYNPWDQRVCLVPEGDLFESIKSGKTTVVTDQIETFTETGIRLQSGQELEADLIVTATGLKLQLLGGVEVHVDGERVHFPDTMTYKGMMFSDVPNMAMSIGYTNASWTLKCDLTCEFVARLLNHMKERAYDQVCPRADPSLVDEDPMLDFTSGYVVRSIQEFPKQGRQLPWRSYQNYMVDVWTVAFGSIEDGALEFGRRPAPSASRETEQAA